MNESEESEERIKIMTLGNSEVGKTSFIMRYTEDSFSEIYLATIGIDFKVKNIIINDKIYKLFFYDTTGQEKYKSISFNIIKNAQGIIIMYDITNKKSFESLKEWINNVKELKGKNFPMILLGNKIDKENERIISTEYGQDLANEYKIDFFETSSKTCINIQESITILINKILERREKENDLSNETKSTKLKSKKTKKRKCC